ncbi:MAG: hypothetical protein AAF725_03295 [Acidobacteriota bacterium]
MLEVRLLAFFSVLWILVFLSFAGLIPAAGLLGLDLYRLYSVAAVLGWTSGNVFQLRRSSPSLRRWANPLLVYLVGPASIVLLLRSLAPLHMRGAAPFVPLYALVVYCVFFLVPVTLAATRTPRLRR